MTSALIFPHAVHQVPTADAVVLANRQLRPDTDPATLSRFRDDRWVLSPAIFEEHFRALSINFQLAPPSFRLVLKTFTWLEINHADAPTLRHGRDTGRLAIQTIHKQVRHTRALLSWLDERNVGSLSDVTSADLDAYLDAVRSAEIRHSARDDLLQAVRRLWAFRDLLPTEDQLPEQPPWNGTDTRLLLGRSTRARENLTQRIPEAAMMALLSWALRFVEDFSDDILIALAEYRPLFDSKPGRRQRPGAQLAPESTRPREGPDLAARLRALLHDLRERRDDLPGKTRPDGHREPDWAHLGRLLNCRYQSIQAPQHRRAIEQSGLALADGAYLGRHPKARLDDAPWMARIRFDEVDSLVRLLSTACLIVIAYLSGMRPGEVLSLRRGCLSQDLVTSLWRIDGRKWKNALDTTGAKLPEGQQRENPWIVVEAVGQAVTVLEQLHDSPLLFPAWILNSSNARDGAKTYQSANDDLNRFTAWINTYCSTHHRIDSIPADIGNLTASRFRRTLAWFICRRPRGLVAAAIQYGHLQVQITQGYSGSYASGFPDDLAFERWLARLDELDLAERRIAAGEHVSGPAADAYRSRVTGGSGQFAGHVIRTGRQARHILANPALQIHSGAAMTCVFAVATALCTLAPATDDARYTPDVDDCRPGCQNIARTEDNINELRRTIDRLRVTVDDAASPPIRLARQRHRLAQIEAIVADHDNDASPRRA